MPCYWWQYTTRQTASNKVELKTFAQEFDDVLAAEKVKKLAEDPVIEEVKEAKIIFQANLYDHDVQCIPSQ